jgi:hypothetical protein
MRTRIGSLATLALCLPLLAANITPRQQDGWIPLGMRQVTDRLDHDLIVVTAERGAFRQIKFSVQRASVDFRRVVVHYGNGADQEIELRHTIPGGGESRAIDLDGKDRVVRSVEFWYDANTRRGRQAVVRLFGMR